MMIFVAVLVGCVGATSASGDMKYPCCLRKVVGEVEYTLVTVDTEATEEYHCKNNCVYTTEEGGRFCFRVGELESTCVDHLPTTIESELAPTSTTELGLYGGLVMIGGNVDGKNFSDNVQVLGDNCTYVPDIGPSIMFGAGVAVGMEFIYVCGGYTAEGGWDNPTNVCSVTYIGYALPIITIPNMNTSRALFTMNNVDSKQVVVGGRNDGDNSLNSVEIMSGIEEDWILQSYTISPARYSHCAVTISSSSILLLGGMSNSGPISTMERLDISTGVETPYPNLSEAIYGHSCSMLEDQIFVAGGVVDGNIVNTVYSMEIVSESIIVTKPISHMVSARAYFAMGVVDGQLTVYSGYGDGEATMETLTDGGWKPESADPTRYGSVSVQICLDE